MPAVFHCDAGQTMLVGGPAKITLVADDPPVTATRPSPTLTSIAPSTAVHGTADVVVTITGTNYSQFTKATINGVNVATTYISATQVSCLMPVASVGAAGSVSVGVHNGNKASTTTNFTYT